VGEFLVNEFNFKPMFGLRAVDFGELIFVGIVGLFLLLSFVLAYFKGTTMFRKRTIDLFVLLAFMIFFGIGFDMLHEILGENLKVGFVIGLIEDGGEMVVMTLIVWYVYQLIISDKKVKSYLFEILYPKQVKI
jgi:hypothetical protein